MYEKNVVAILNGETISALAWNQKQSQRKCVVTAGRKNFLIAAKFQLAERQEKESNIPL
jgi:hypothetical protein